MWLGFLLACGAVDNVRPQPRPAPSVSTEPAAARPEPEAAGFVWESGPIPEDVRRQMVGVSWREGCPTPLDDLRLVALTHWGFDGRVATGRLVLHREAVEPVGRAFEAAFDARFPIRSVTPIDAYGGSDDKSMAADNTSAFNCRPIKGTNAWSEHATGKAIDVNPRENPWVKGDKVDPPEGLAFVARDPAAPGVLVAESAMVRAFREAGWGWGGTWSSLKDYQHFSASGR